MTDVVLFAEVVHHMLATEAELGFEGIMAVVEARVDDLGVATAGLGPDGAMLLD